MVPRLQMEASRSLKECQERIWKERGQERFMSFGLRNQAGTCVSAQTCKGKYFRLIRMRKAGVRLKRIMLKEAIYKG
jgi:hypothetical protein